MHPADLLPLAHLWTFVYHSKQKPKRALSCGLFAICRAGVVGKFGIERSITSVPYLARHRLFDVPSAQHCPGMQKAAIRRNDEQQLLTSYPTLSKRLTCSLPRKGGDGDGRFRVTPSE